MFLPGASIKTYPFNLSSNVVLTVEGTIRGIENQEAWPKVPALPTYFRDADFHGKFRRLSLVHVSDSDNITIRGRGVIDGAGWYWYPFFSDRLAANHIGRPHLIELKNCTNVELVGVTLKDSAFWTIHPVYCRNVYIHDMKILAPSCRNYKCANTDGIDIDSCENVLVEHNYIDVGDDHVTILAGEKQDSPMTRNITIQHNDFRSGMGLSIGSRTAGGIQDVLYYNNVITEQKRMGITNGIHIKLRDRFMGYVRNVAWIDNVFYVAGLPGGAIKFEAGYQTDNAKRRCTKDGKLRCPEVRDIVVRNMTVHEGGLGFVGCYGNTPCVNITFDNVRFLNNPKNSIKCSNVASGMAINTYPTNLFDPESCSALYRNDGATAAEVTT